MLVGVSAGIKVPHVAPVPITAPTPDPTPLAPPPAQAPSCKGPVEHDIAVEGGASEGTGQRGTPMASGAAGSPKKAVSEGGNSGLAHVPLCKGLPRAGLGASIVLGSIASCQDVEVHGVLLSNCASTTALVNNVCYLHSVQAVKTASVTCI